MSAAATELRSTTSIRPALSLVPAPEQVVLQVELVAPDGSRWTALGGGDSVEAAVAFARESAPAGVAWEPVAAQPLYGD